jgi:hypothetical protein
MADDRSMDGVARDAETLLDVLQAFECEGYTSQFAARDAAQIECMTCKTLHRADAVNVRQLRRLEGASDPDDMLAVAALTCASCGARGTLILNYGPAASTEDAEVLRGLERPPPPDPDAVEREAASPGNA